MIRYQDIYFFRTATSMESIRRFARTLGRIAQTRYPGFLFGLRLGRGEIPIFTYHEARVDEFTRDLEYLRRNGYRTLSLAEFFRESVKKGTAAKSVLLTFDDARKSFWDVGVPLLQEFQARATLFVPTYWMTPAAMRYRSTSTLFMSWEQVRAALDSGLVDVQSHAHRHALVNTSDRLIGFATPDALAKYDIYDWPLRNVHEGEELGYPELGTPIYSAAPLLSAEHRFIEDPDIAQACQRHVRDHGGADFFRHSDWQQQLRRVYDDVTESRDGRTGEQMTDADFRALVASEFEECRARFRTQLGYDPGYLAYPWMLGSPYSLQLARDFGMSAAFGVALDYGKAKSRSLPLPVFGRLKADWLPLLPGLGRSSLSSMLTRKISGFSRDQNLAH
jgi:peptidoglycan/xylan/chitin deacetylase (PgdA/CDA1 family)